MLPGYNHNIRYQDKVFHIQTEDSGIDNPHIITHLFRGGNIIETRKTAYADIVGTERMKEMLVDLMQDQHKGMLRDLIKGQIDGRIAERSQNAATLSGPAPLNVEAGGQNRTSFGFDSRAPKAPASAPVKAPPPAAPIAPPNVASAPPPRAIPVPPPLPPRPTTPAAASPAAAAVGLAAPAGQTDFIIEAETLQKAFESNNESAVDSIFGEDLISEKSLDEVILSYLAEDMQKG